MSARGPATSRARDPLVCLSQQGCVSAAAGVSKLERLEDRPHQVPGVSLGLTFDGGVCTKVGTARMQFW